MDKLVEHYGIILGESTLRRITERHAQQIFEMTDKARVWPTQPGASAVVIVEMDGGMVPLVEPDATQKDQRKGKKTCTGRKPKSAWHIHREAEH